MFPKIIANTYLPGAAQPGFRQKLEALTQGSRVSVELLTYAAKELETDKFYFLQRLFGARRRKRSDALPCGSGRGLSTGQMIKRSYRRITGNVAIYDTHGIRAEKEKILHSNIS